MLGLDKLNRKLDMLRLCTESHELYHSSEEPFVLAGMPIFWTLSIFHLFFSSPLCDPTIKSPCNRTQYEQILLRER